MEQILSSRRVSSGKKVNSSGKPLDQQRSPSVKKVNSSGKPLAQQRSPRRLSLSKIRSGTHNFADFIGAGGEGSVYRGALRIEGKAMTVAVKVLVHDYPQFEEEIKTVFELNHPNLVTLVGYCKEDGERIMVYEYMCNGSLADFLDNHSNGHHPLTWKQRAKICIGIARGLEYLHAGTSVPNGIIHRDIKPSNILLDKDWTPKISDFGLSRKFNPYYTESHNTARMIKGTYGYLAPEYVLHKKLSRKIDVFAFGLVLFELLCGISMWERNQSYYRDDTENLAAWTEQNVIPELKMAIPQECLQAFTVVVDKCLKVNPKERPQMTDVVRELEEALYTMELAITSMEAKWREVKNWLTRTKQYLFPVESAFTSLEAKWKEVKNWLTRTKQYLFPVLHVSADTT